MTEPRMTVAEAERTGDWSAYERGRPHYDTDGWCRCCCDDCNAGGCSQVSNPAPCQGHPAGTP